MNIAQGPEGAKERYGGYSVPNIPRIVWYVMPLQERQIFCLKTDGSMMFLLTLNVRDDLRNRGLAYTERAVTRLPCKRCMLRAALM